MLCWLDGLPANALPPADRGLAYGDGLFETLAVKDGRPRLLQRHLARLAEGCQRLAITLDVSAVADELERFAARLGEGVAKLIVTRGDGQRGYAPAVNQPARRILLGSPFPAYPKENAAQGIALFPCRTRLAEQPLLAGLKHLNRLEQVLARAEWQGSEYAEGLMCDSSGRLIEGVFSNLFMVKNGELLTPALNRCGVAGVMRGLIIDLAASAHIALQVRDIDGHELPAACEVFVCNSLYGIWPVRRFAAQSWQVGALTRTLQRLLATAED